MSRQRQRPESTPKQKGERADYIYLFPIAKLIDLEMLVIAGGKERSEAEYRHLLAGAGWRLSRVIPTGSPAQIVEAKRA